MTTLGLLATGVLALYEVSPWLTLRYACYLYFVILLPGKILWQWMSRAGGVDAVHGLERWAFGAAAGYGLELVAYSLSRWAGYPQFYVVAPLGVIAMAGFRGDLRSPKMAIQSPSWVNWGVAGVAGFLVVHLAVKTFGAHRIQPYRLWDVDESFQLALVGELRHHFPAQYPYVDIGPLTYQWFVHAHMAASTWATGLDAVLVYRRFDVLVLSVLAVLGTVALATRLTARAWPGLVAGALLVLVGTFDISGAVRGEAAPEERFLEAGVLLNSPTQAMAFAMTPALVALCLAFLEQPPRWSRWVPMVVGMLLLSGTKATVVPIVLAGFAMSVAVAALTDRSRVQPAIIGLLTAGGSLVISGAVLYSGDSHSLRLDPGQATDFFMRALGMEAQGVVASVFLSLCLLVMWLVSAAGALGFVGSDFSKDVRVWWLIGAAVAGLGATFLLGHVGLSQIYFGRTVAPLLAVLSAWGLSLMFPPSTQPKVARRALAVAFAAGLLVLATRFVTESLRVSLESSGEVIMTPALRLWVNLPAVLLLVLAFLAIRLVVKDVTKRRVVIGLRWLVVFLLGLGLARTMAFAMGNYPTVKDGPAARVISSGGADAALWLRQNSEPTEWVITNAHCLPEAPEPGDCDSRHFWMSALSERRFRVEGWAYTRFTEDWFSDYPGDPTVLAAHDAFFASPAQATLAELLEVAPADWLWLEGGSPAQVEQILGLRGVRLAQSSGDSYVFRLPEVGSGE